MAIKELYDLSAEEQEAHTAKWGGGNEFPSGWRRVTPSEFAQSRFMTYGPWLVEYRQMMPQTKEEKAHHKFMIGAHLYFFWDETGYALVRKHNDKTHRDDGMEFFVFGCDHEYEYDPDFKPQFRCNHGYKCKKCGHKFNVDSSD